MTNCKKLTVSGGVPDIGALFVVQEVLFNCRKVSDGLAVSLLLILTRILHEFAR